MPMLFFPMFFGIMFGILILTSEPHPWFKNDDHSVS